MKFESTGELKEFGDVMDELMSWVAFDHTGMNALGHEEIARHFERTLLDLKPDTQ